MNVIYIHTHDTGRYISPYGYNSPTPSLQSFAEDAITFKNMHCVCPTCSPSRSALLTGRYPHNNGMLGLAHMKFNLNNYEEHLSAHMRGHGYTTVLCGVQHETSNLDDLSYDEILTKNLPGYTNIGFKSWDLRNSRIVCDYIKNYNSDKPLYLSFGMVNTHRPFIEAEIDERYVCPPVHIPDTAENRKDYAMLLTGVKVVDECFKNILESLKEKGMYDDSLILFTTDHGIAYPHMKCNLTDWGTGVSFILRVPDGKKGVVCDEMLSQLDFMPTLFDILEWKKPDYFQGKSFKNLLYNDDVDNIPIHEEIYGEVTFHAGYQPMRSVREHRFKYIVHFDAGEVIPVNIDAGIAKDFVQRYGLFDRLPCTEYLYDLMLDPCEKINLAKVEKYNTEIIRLRKKLLKHMQDTDDILLKGINEIHGKPIWNKDGTGYDERFA